MNSVFLKYKNVKPTIIAIVGVLLFLFAGAERVGGTTYYTFTNGNPASTTVWWTATNGTGSHPGNFTTAGDVFIIQNNNTMTATGAWLVGAAGTTASSIQISSGCTLAMGANLLTLASCNLTNSGSFSGSGGVTITGTLASNTVGAFSTTGTITFSKTAGTTTLQGNVSGAALTLSTTATNATFSLNGNSMTLTGGVTISRPSANPITLAVGSGTLTCTTITLGGTGTTSARSSTLSISTGTVTASGNITSAGIYSYITFTGAGTLNAGGTFMSGTAGTFTASTGTVNFNGTSAQTIPNATYNFNHIKSNNTNASGATFAAAVTTTNVAGNIIVGDVSTGSILNTNNLAVARTTGDGVTVAAGSIFDTGTTSIGWNVAGQSITIDGTLRTANTAGFSGGAGTAISSTNSPTITLGANSTIEYDAVGSQTVTSRTYSNMTISGSGAKTLAGDVTVTNQLTLTDGLLTLGSNNLSIGSAAPAVSGTFSATNMIVTDGTGEVRKLFTSGASSYTFPIGETTGTAEYSPMTVSFTSATCAGGAYLGVKVKDAAHPSYTAPSGGSYLTRYWTVTPSGITAYSASVSATYVAADISGSWSNIITGRYDGGWVKYDAATSTTISATNQMSFGDYTGVNSLPLITTSTSSLSGFSYVGGLGPSAEQSFTVSGNDLTTNINITPLDDFEISTGTGGSFFAMSPIVLNVSSYTVPTTTIYVRMKAGLSTGSIGPENIAVESAGATTKNVACSGTVVVTPLITTSVSSITTGLDYIFGSGPSAYSSFTVTGTNLTANITVTPPTDYSICATSGGTYVSTPLTITQSGGNASGTIYMKLNAGLTQGAFTENIALTSTNAVTKYVSCTGNVNAATVTVSKFNLGGFIYTSGAGPSGEQTVVVSGSSLSADITLTAPTNFEISTVSGSGFAASKTLTRSGTSVAATTIYVRMKAALSVGTYGPSNLTAASSGAITQNVILSGQVVSAATSISSNNTLVGFAYLYGYGPSVEQSFTVSASSLTNNITVTPPSSNFEISLTSGSGFVSYPSTLTITQSGGKVNAVPVYVRLKGGLAIATYATQNIVLSSTGTTSVNVGCSGVVIAVPTITASISSPTPPVCNGNTVQLTSSGTGITNQYWSGPNSFYSALASPATFTASATTAGTYTVTGSALSGVNLLTNGDFESGNTGFGSTYGYVTPSSTALSTGGTGAGESLYTITNASYPTPNSVHSGFSACADHSSPGSYQMVINGATNPGVIAWSASVSVVPNADYQFSYYVQSVVAGNPAQLQLYVNGVPAGEIYTADLATCSWKQFVYNTNAGSNTVLQLTLINQNTIAGGNDFALDDIVFQQVFPVSSTVDLTVYPILAPSVAVTASSNPVFTGTAVTYTATPTNAGTPTYQWYVGGVIQSGETNSTFTNSPTNGQVVSCTITSSLPCASPTTASNSVTMTVNARGNYWVGSLSTDWSVLGNWSAGFPPASGDDVEYADGTNIPGTTAQNDLYLDQNRTIGSLVNVTTKRLVIPEGKGLTVNNTITSTGTNKVDKIYIYSSSTGANGSLIFHNAVNNPVYGTVEMYSKATYVSTNATNNKFFWQYFGIPLRSVVANPTLYGAYVRKWYESGTDITNHWIQQDNDSTLYSFKGYEICQTNPTTYFFQGILENGDFSSGQLAYTSSALYPGQHIFANPYTAAINIKNLTFGSETEATVYMYNAGSFTQWTNNGGETSVINNSGIVAGQYNSAPKATAGTLGIPGQVPSMQAMLIKAKSASASATFNISYNSVVQINTDPQRAPGAKNGQSDSGMTGVKFMVKGENGIDKMWLLASPGCTRSFDNGWDGAKIIGSSLYPQLYANEPDGIYQVDAVSDLNETELAFQAGTDVEYTLSVENQNIKSSYPGLYLVDMIENKTIDISESGTKYTFVSASTPSPVKRFKIVSRYYEKGAPDLDSKVKIFSSKGMIFVDNQSSNNGQMMIYDISGHLVKKVPFAGNTITSVNSGLNTGAYIAKCSTELEEVAKRIIVR